LKAHRDSSITLSVRDESLIERKNLSYLKICKPKPQLRSGEIHLKRSSTCLKPINTNCESSRVVKPVTFLIDQISKKGSLRRSDSKNKENLEGLNKDLVSVRVDAKSKKFSVTKRWVFR
jgi:hypothetical protein